MAVKFALPLLVEAVVARFALEGPWQVAPVVGPPAIAGVPVPNLFGWKKPEQQQIRGTRIVWVPGDDENGDAGDYAAARNGSGKNPRSLAALGELFTVYLVAQDKSEPELELAQYNAARALHDAWFRALHLAYFGTFKLGKPRWYGEAKERRAGACLRVLGTVNAPIPDAISESVPADAHAEVDVDDLDRTESFTTDEAPIEDEEP